MLQQPLQRPCRCCESRPPRGRLPPRLPVARRPQSVSASRPGPVLQLASRVCSACCAQGASPPLAGGAAVAAALRWRRCITASPDAPGVAVAWGQAALSPPPRRSRRDSSVPPFQAPSGRRSARAQADSGGRRRAGERLAKASCQRPQPGTGLGCMEARKNGRAGQCCPSAAGCRVGWRAWPESNRSNQHSWYRLEHHRGLGRTPARNT